MYLNEMAGGGEEEEEIMEARACQSSARSASRCTTIHMVAVKIQKMSPSLSLCQFQSFRQQSRAAMHKYRTSSIVNVAAARSRGTERAAALSTVGSGSHAVASSNKSLLRPPEEKKEEHVGNNLQFPFVKRKFVGPEQVEADVDVAAVSKPSSKDGAESVYRLPSSLMKKPFNGGCLILVDKPKEWTSFDVCKKLGNRLKVAYGIKKVGHAGTLDPMATGLLIVCVGKATKMQQVLMGGDKSYEGVIRLGEGTASYDAETDVDEIASWQHIKRSQLLEARDSLTGVIEQVPPMYSALKVKGKRLYSLAREGQVVERKARQVTIKSFDLYFEDSQKCGDDHNKNDKDVTLTRQDVRFSVSCSSGTYIRSLAYDLGRAVGSVAHLTELRRTECCGHMIADAWTVEDCVSEIAAIEKSKRQ